MIAFHLGFGAVLTYVTLGRRRIDYRYVLAGAVLPDAVDALLAVWLDPSGSGRAVGHSLLAVVAIGAAVVVAFRGERRLAIFGIAVGWLTHLVGDGMWQAPRTFLWPLFGPGFAAAPAEPYGRAFADPLASAWTWAGEAAGVAALWWLWAAHRLGEDARLGLFLRDGYLRP